MYHSSILIIQVDHEIQICSWFLV